MPELPDLELYSKEFNSQGLNQTIKQVQVDSESLLADISAQGLGRALKSHRFVSSERYGKWLFLLLDNEKYLAMHFGMTGKLVYYENSKAAPGFTRLTILFDNNHNLAYVSRRQLGRVHLADSRESFIQSKELGPDALTMSEKQFLQLATEHRGGVKAWLMNQHILAGIGNVYSDEILFQARLHPNCPLSNLDQTQLRKLYKAIHSVLTTAIKHNGDRKNLPASYLTPQRKSGGQCPGCGDRVEKMKAAGREAWYCPKCQSEDAC